ncbi:MAG: hypothetical protein AAFX06_02100 [Planctomycetota bacterium]
MSISMKLGDIQRASVRSLRRRRGGYLYVAVLFTSLIVGAAVAIALSLDTTRLKSQNANADRGTALRLAEGELQRLAVQLDEDASWRFNETHAALSAWRSTIEGARIRYQVNDADGDLSDDDLDDAQIVAHVVYGSSQAAVSVNLETGFAPLDMLRYSVTSTDDIELENGSLLVTEGHVQVQDDCKTVTTGAIVCERLECSNQIQVPVRGDIAASSVDVPTGGEIIDRYVATGTEIPYANLPNDGLKGLRRIVLSKNVNPMGPTDPNGIYWIDCGGQAIYIGEARIHATVAIRNAAFVLFTGGLIWESPEPMGAIFLSGSPVFFNGYNSHLDETATGVNFNPQLVPIEGEFDATTDDRYGSLMRGVFYCRNNVTLFSSVDSAPIHLTGSMIARDLILNVDLHVHSAPELMTSVPFGFVDTQRVRFLSGTFRRVPVP